MKKGLLISALLLAASMITSCGFLPGEGDHPGGGGSGGGGGGTIDTETTVDVYFFVDFNNDDTDNPFMKLETYNGRKLTQPSSIPACPDPAFPVFKGWSKYPVIDDLGKLWNFSRDVVNEDDYLLHIYGIWVSE